MTLKNLINLAKNRGRQPLVLTLNTRFSRLAPPALIEGQLRRRVEYEMGCALYRALELAGGPLIVFPPNEHRGLEDWATSIKHDIEVWRWSDLQEILDKEGDQ